MRITEILIIACVFVFLGQLALGASFEENVVLRPVDLMHEPWLVFSSMFGHGDVQHIAFNMFALFIFGGALERTVGRGNFLLLYLVSGVVGSIGFMLLSSPFSSALGASGAIYGVIGAVALLLPKMRIYLMGVPMPMYVAGFIYVLIELVGLAGAADGIAHSAHLLGMVGGFGIALWLRGRFDDFGIEKAFAVGLVFSLTVGLGFGYYYNMDSLNSKIGACEDQEIETVDDVITVLACLEDLAEEYKNEPAKKEIVCGEYAKYGTYISNYRYSELYDECITG